MDKSMKLYSKAINYYNEGKLEKALEYCEKSISDNIKNSSAINLKGLLFYLKGELESAQALWKMNYQVNKDMVAKKYFEDSKKDEEYKSLCSSAVKLIKELKIQAAVEMLNECSESDFNSINVNNYLTICCIKLGDYSLALKCIDKVLKIDKDNKTALENRKELEEFGIIKKQHNYKYMALAVALVFIGAAAIAIPKVMNHSSVSKSKNDIQVKENKEIPKASDNTPKVVSKQPEQTVNKPNVEVFPTSEASNAVESKNYDKLYDIISKWQDKDLNMNDKTILVKAKELVAVEGVQYFYNSGSKYLSSKDYVNAQKYFLRAYTFAQESYLRPHIVYMLAFSYKNTGDIENASKFYKEYLNKYPKGDYEDTVLYDLALIYKGIDANASKSYAAKIVKDHPSSIYNNSTIKDILSK